MDHTGFVTYRDLRDGSQNRNDVPLVRRHCKPLYREVGDGVRMGEVISIKRR